MGMKNPFDKILNWYFTKNSLPYWSIFLIDCFIIIMSGVVTYLVFHDAPTLYENTFKVLNTMFCFVLLSIPGFRIFHTYSGFMRYSSFVDLMRVVYGNIVSLCLALIAHFGAYLLPHDYFAYFSATSIVLTFTIATLLMWALRIFVKTLYDVAFSNTRAVRVLIYGAMSGGVGLAKNIMSQRPRRFVVKGFISRHKNTKHQQIMGERVYSVCEDIAQIIKDNDIEGVLVAPYRTKEFRFNQELQDVILGAGAKIYMAENAKEVIPGNEERNGDDYGNLQLKEVNVEELLPARVKAIPGTEDDGMLYPHVVLQCAKGVRIHAGDIDFVTPRENRIMVSRDDTSLDMPILPDTFGPVIEDADVFLLGCFSETLDRKILDRCIGETRQLLQHLPEKAVVMYEDGCYIMNYFIRNINLHSEDSAHGRSDNFRIIYIRRVTADNNSRNTGCFSRPNDCSEITRILKSFQDKNKWLWDLLPFFLSLLISDYILQGIMFHFYRGNDSLGCLGIAHFIHAAFRNFFTDIFIHIQKNLKLFAISFKCSHCIIDTVNTSLRDFLNHPHAFDYI